MRILSWHVDGAWTPASVQGRHTSLAPVDEAGRLARVGGNHRLPPINGRLPTDLERLA